MVFKNLLLVRKIHRVNFDIEHGVRKYMVHCEEVWSVEREGLKVGVSGDGDG